MHYSHGSNGVKTILKSALVWYAVVDYSDGDGKDPIRLTNPTFATNAFSNVNASELLPPTLSPTTPVKLLSPTLSPTTPVNR